MSLEKALLKGRCSLKFPITPCQRGKKHKEKIYENHEIRFTGLDAGNAYGERLPIKNKV